LDEREEEDEAGLEKREGSERSGWRGKKKENDLCEEELCFFLLFMGFFSRAAPS
jgi:hypothetical protein